MMHLGPAAKIFPHRALDDENVLVHAIIYTRTRVSWSAY